MAPFEVASVRQVRRDDIAAVYTLHEGKLVNILEDPALYKKIVYDKLHTDM